MLRVEFHCHTQFSKDSLAKPADILEVCRRKGVDRLVITDHNNITGALKTKELDPERVIVGEEIMTRSGELLASFMTEEVPKGLPAEEAIERLRTQGAFISVSHPFDVYRSGHWALEELEKIAPLVDAIEVFNARCITAGHNTAAMEFARSHNLAGTAGSDAHAAFEVGRATLRLPDFSTADELRAVIRQGEVVGALSSPFVHFTSRWAVWRKSSH